MSLSWLLFTRCFRSSHYARNSLPIFFFTSSSAQISLLHAIKYAEDKEERKCSRKCRAGSTRAGCPQLCLLRFWIPSRISIFLQPVMVFNHPYSETFFFSPLGLNVISCISICSRCLLACHRAPRRKARL